VKSLKAILENWEKYKPIRGMIEDIFKLAKNVFSLLTQRRNYRRLPNGSWWRGLKIFINFMLSVCGSTQVKPKISPL